MAKTTSRLGKGLTTLITPQQLLPPQATIPPPAPLQGDRIHLIPIDAISPNPRQPRTAVNDQSLADLADSIRVNGILQPLLVRSIGHQSFELIAGERRWRAAKVAGLKEVPAIVRDVSDSESFQFALVENLQREDLTPLERAAAYQHYLDSFGGTIEDLGRRLSQSRANISNYLRLLKLGPEICYMLGRGELGMGQARAIAGLTDPQRQLAIARLAARRNLSVRQVEQLVRDADKSGGEPRQKEAPAAQDASRRHLRDVEGALTKALGLSVQIRPGRRKNSGRVLITYGSLEDFDRIAERLGGSVHLEQQE
jgi:ParB family chromosome partitioning protein